MRRDLGSGSGGKERRAEEVIEVGAKVDGEEGHFNMRNAQWVILTLQM